MQRQYLLTLTTALFAALGATAVGQMTLDDAIIKALAADPTIPKVHADVTEAEGFAKETKADLLPQLSLEGRAGLANRDRGTEGGDTLFSRRGTITGRQFLWDGGFNWNRWQDAKQRTLAKEQLDKAQRENTALNTVDAYLDVIRSRKQIGWAKQSLEAHSKVLDLAKKRAEAAGNQADIELSLARYNLARTLVMERELALRQAEATFVRWVGHKPPNDLTIPKVPEISSLGEIVPEQNFHYLATLKQREAAELEKKALQAKYGPRFFLEATAGLGQDVLGTKGTDNDASVLIVGSWDIFDGGRRKAQIQQAAADIDRQIAIIQETLVLLNQDITARWEDYKTIQQRLKILRDYAGALGKTVTLYQQQFDLGTRPLLSLLDIQNEVISASVRITDGERDHALLGYRLLFFGGRLIRETVGAEYLETNPKPHAKNPPSKSTVPLDSASKKAAPPTTAIATAKPGFRTHTDLRAVASN
jgi:adhesin transport system outer membrane protein